MELHRARDEAHVARLQAAVSSSCVSPELARGDDEDGARLAEDNRRLVEEVSALRVQIKEMSLSAREVALAGGPGSPADQQRPALRVIDAVAGHGATAANNSKAWVTLKNFDTNTTDGVSEPEGVDELVSSSSASSRPEDGSSPTPRRKEISDEISGGGSEEGKGFSSVQEEACAPAQRRSCVALARPLAALASPANNNGVSADDGGVGSESNNSSGGGVTDESCDFRRLVEAETERVLAELRANLPSSTKALLQARGEMEACATSAMARLQSSKLSLPTAPSTGASSVLKSSGLGGDEVFAP